MAQTRLDKNHWHDFDREREELLKLHGKVKLYYMHLLFTKFNISSCIKRGFAAFSKDEGCRSVVEVASVD